MKKLLCISAFLFAGCQQKADIPAQVTKQELPDFLITSLTAVPGWSLVETKGFYCNIFQYAGTGDYVDKFNESIAGIKKEGKKQGANALFNFQVSSESHEIQGSKWHASIVHICGDLVTLK